MLITQLIVLINEPITDASCEEINVLILQLINELINENGQSENGNSNASSDIDTKTNSDDNSSGNTSNNNSVVKSSEDVVTNSDEIKDLVTQIICLINESNSTPSVKEKIIELISQLLNILTKGSDNTIPSDPKDANEDTIDTSTDVGDTNGSSKEATNEKTEVKDESSENNSNEIICSVNQLLTQLKTFINEPIESIDKLTYELICQLINVLTNKDGENSDTNSSPLINATVIGSEQIQELITQLINQLCKPIENMNSLNELILDLIKQLTTGKVEDQDTNHSGENNNSESENEGNTSTVITTTTTMPGKLFSVMVIHISSSLFDTILFYVNYR